MYWVLTVQSPLKTLSENRMPDSFRQGFHQQFLWLTESYLRTVIQKSEKPFGNSLLFPSGTEFGAISVSSFDPKRKLNGAST